jgi:RNA polymerase sigma-70 factor (ECF subfamily)
MDRGGTHREILQIWREILRVQLQKHNRTSVPDPNEEKAIRAAQKGDGAAFETLYTLHKKRVYSLCLRMTGSTAEAEDLTQEAFMQLFRKISTFRGESAFSTWLHRMTVNVVLMHLRKRVPDLISIDETLEGAEETAPPRQLEDKDLRLAGSVDRVALERAIRKLPAGYRTIFILHDIEGYEHNEIAKILGCSIGNSKSQLHKARMRLRDLVVVKGEPAVQDAS